MTPSANTTNGLPPAIKCLKDDIIKGLDKKYDILEAQGLISAYYPEGTEPPEWLLVLAGGNYDEYEEVHKLVLEEIEKENKDV